MKSIDEVITSLQEQIDDEMNCEYSSNWIVSKYDVEDALHYLKQYRDCQNQQKMANKSDSLPEAENKPLDWDELRQMEGKPVWVEALLYKQWAVIAYVGDDHIRFEGVNLYAPESRIYMGEKNGWQAYRKERE